MRIYNTSEKYTKWIILLFLSLSILMPFVELSIVRIGFGAFESNIVNSFILTILVGFLFLLNPIIGNRGLLILFYIIFKGLHGVVNGADIGGVSITLITFLLIFRMYIFFYRMDFIGLIWYLKKTNILLLFVLILTSEINFLVNGHRLPILVQNLSIVIFLSASYLIWLEGRKNIYNSQFYTVIVILTYIGVVLAVRDSFFSAIQIKFFIFTALIVSYFTILKLFSGFFNRPMKKFNQRHLLSGVIVILIIFMFIYPLLVENFSTSFNRGNSGNVRLQVNEFMINRVNQDWYTKVFGYGLGSSIERFYLGMHYGNPLNTVAHSGIYIYYYEHGLLGGLFFLFIFYTAIKKMLVINTTNGLFMQECKIGNTLSRGSILTFFFIISMYFLLNMVIISSMPGPNVFWNSNIIMFIILLILSCRIIFLYKKTRFT